MKPVGTREEGRLVVEPGVGTVSTTLPLTILPTSPAVEDPLLAFQLLVLSTNDLEPVKDLAEGIGKEQVNVGTGAKPVYSYRGHSESLTSDEAALRNKHSNFLFTAVENALKFREGIAFSDTRARAINTAFKCVYPLVVDFFEKDENRALFTTDELAIIDRGLGFFKRHHKAVGAVTEKLKPLTI